MSFNPKFKENFLFKPNNIPTFGYIIRSLREVLEINPGQIENIRLSHIPNWDMMEPTIFYGFRPVKKSNFIPPNFRADFTSYKINMMTISLSILMVQKKAIA